VVTLADLCVTRGKFFRRDWSGWVALDLSFSQLGWEAFSGRGGHGPNDKHLNDVWGGNISGHTSYQTHPKVSMRICSCFFLLFLQLPRLHSPALKVILYELFPVFPMH
jgi:hypothetical protein